MAGDPEEAGLSIDPDSAEVMWSWGDCRSLRVDTEFLPTLDSMDACSSRALPGSDIWVSFYDLPGCVSDTLLKRHGSALYFPAGLALADGGDI